MVEVKVKRDGGRIGAKKAWSDASRTRAEEDGVAQAPSLFSEAVQEAPRPDKFGRQNA